MSETQKPLVLLIDDDRFLVDMYSLKFTKEGYQVLACLSAKEALESLREGLDPTAVVFDLVMPEHDGFDLLQTIKEEGLAKNAVLVALSNQAADEEHERTKELGADEYIVKASTVPSDVVSMIGEMIQKKH